ncbi:MAG: PD-(D/E)XK nuclease family transposase, partial [Spirochaetota bacterium]|nr:PD-(D/E)XK nuclease family transposase [Spirochaetota bacterium]
MSKYINPYTDFGFKKLFGTEANKEVLIDFLNELVNKEHKIKDLTFKNTENFGDLEKDRKAIFDI